MSLRSAQDYGQLINVGTFPFNFGRRKKVGSAGWAEREGGGHIF